MGVGMWVDVECTLLDAQMKFLFPTPALDYFLLSTISDFIVHNFCPFVMYQPE